MIYTGKYPFKINIFQAYNLKYFVSTSFSPKQYNSRARYSKILRHKCQRGLVRSTFYRRRV